MNIKMNDIRDGTISVTEEKVTDFHEIIKKNKAKLKQLELNEALV